MEQFLFSGVQELHEAIVDTVTNACMRFGAEKAELAICSCADGVRRGDSDDGIIEHVLFETGGTVTMTYDDINFVKEIMTAGRDFDRCMDRFELMARKAKKEIINGK